MFENDASSAGVLHGGLFSTTEIRILICYVLSTLNEPIPANRLVNTLHAEGIANAFEVSDAIVSLEKTGHIKQVDKEEDSYVTTPLGVDASETLKNSLSLTVRDRACRATLKMLLRYKHAKSTKFETFKENGKSFLSCSLMDGDTAFMTVKLQVGDEYQAQIVKEHFLDNPAEIYLGMVELLTK